jgi:hypothetical protein
MQMKGFEQDKSSGMDTVLTGHLYNYSPAFHSSISHMKKLRAGGSFLMRKAYWENWCF